MVTESASVAWTPQLPPGQLNVQFEPFRHSKVQPPPVPPQVSVQFSPEHTHDTPATQFSSSALHAMVDRPIRSTSAVAIAVFMIPPLVTE